MLFELSLAHLVLGLWVRQASGDAPQAGADGGSLGPFCSGQDGEFKCKSKRWLCGCASGSCEKGGDIDWEALRNLDFSDGVVRMATFKKEMRVPACMCSFKGGPRLDSSWLVWLLGGKVEVRTLDDGTTCPPCVQAPTHAWSEIELPRSKCYLLLGGQTSAFRDRGIHAFRLVLHDTTFRWWEREQGKFIYDGLLLHRRTPLSHAHVEVLKRIIHHGDRRGSDGASASPDEQFERSLDQDADLNPVFLEFPPASFLFQDDALPGMVTAYAGVFGLHRRLAFFSKPAVNCVVTALLFGIRPRELLALLPRQAHEATRAKARELNDLWKRDIAPIFKQAKRIFQTAVEVPRPPPPPWWHRWWSSRLLPEPRPEVVMLDFQRQIDRFRPAYLSQVLSPLKRALVRHDPELGQQWKRKFALADELVEYRLDEFFALKSRMSEGCEADSAVDQLLFCPDWTTTKYWERRKSRHGSAPLSGSNVVEETDRAVRSLLYWYAADKVNGEAEL